MWKIKSRIAHDYRLLCLGRTTQRVGIGCEQGFITEYLERSEDSCQGLGTRLDKAGGWEF
jgi:hypothetical protein